MTGFGRLLRAEWTKLRTVRGWMAALLGGIAAMVALGTLTGMQGTCTQDTCAQPIGPEGQEVRDAFTFLHRPLTGDGSITVRLTSMTGILPSVGEEQEAPGKEQQTSGKEQQEQVTGLTPWAKTGLMIKNGTQPGATYAAIMMTGAHGVRMQHDFAHDAAGSPGGVPLWLRLTREGDVIIGEESADGRSWTKVREVRLDGLAETVQAGMFATSPQHSEIVQNLVGTSVADGPSEATGEFDQVRLDGDWPAGNWAGTRIGGPDDLDRSGFDADGPEYSVTGSGDVSPAVAGVAGIGATITQTLVGTFVALLAVVVLGAVFMTAEYRRGLVRTTLTAAPHRGHFLAAKAIVLGSVTFVAGVVAAAVLVEVGGRMLISRGVYLHPATTPIKIQIIIGTGLLLACSAVLALALGAILRRSLTAVTTGIALIVLPYLVTVTAVSGAAADWVLRVTPAAAFAVQQSTPEYPQVDNLYTAAQGFFPLPAWGGFAVLAAWTAAALAGAAVLLRRRDA
ncbi:hypothetical protein GCM10010112_25020 [Actinoplanes lobatus]|uniref:ABC-type transport system involved in multi-copper enzyme maturation permease subunit n=1 Tax=Actinoplanes lobatus TaxID=113568 RepID=A0A7W7MJ02_9ACTN|nr:ABC transporter permease subunit [Actinoplanes lobatus]MBB4751545.1 ABC-type transport system involved in multi-copper enzyme maturation permease subunit [Actinoplanes lobatus]GGN64607.1 hypothetical protein GCM10010112_25020 [Actinoplanes lobatus]GIE45950.1 hypothetical protein Alo02nite_88480 [Actinoplanes lobatus]